MGYLLSTKQPIHIYVKEQGFLDVALAVQDLSSDLELLGFSVFRVQHPEAADIQIGLGLFLFTHPEEYVYRITSQGIMLSGSDDLGLMWAIYSFSEQELGISPFKEFNGFNPQKVETLSLQDKLVREHPASKYRGWFLNDEDLLENFSHKGTRPIQYRFYQKVISPELLDKVLETALRNKINLIIPSSLLNIENPDEKALLDLASSRGFYLSQHHIEPLGLSKNSFEAYAKKHGISPEFSYLKNKEGLLSAWDDYAKKWAVYPRVISQLGLRGGTDQPVWKEDEGRHYSIEQWGEIISEAMKEQYAILSKYRENPLTSLTLWMEGASLLEKGALLPPSNDTILVYADIGISQMFGSDFFLKKSLPNPAGAYLHLAYWNTGNHLLEGTDPQKAEYCHTLSLQKGRGEYLIWNVANVKEFSFSATLTAKMAFQGSAFDREQEEKEYAASLFAGASEQKDFLDALSYYYRSFGPIDDGYYQKYCESNDFSYYAYTKEKLSFPVCALSDGFLCWYLRRPFLDKLNDVAAWDWFGKSIQASLKNAKKARMGFQTLKQYSVAPAAFQQKWVYAAFYWENLLQASDEVYQASLEVSHQELGGLLEHFEKAAQCLRDILDFRKECYQGEWAKWIAGDKKLDIPELSHFLAQEGKRLLSYYQEKIRMPEKEREKEISRFDKAFS